VGVARGARHRDAGLGARRGPAGGLAWAEIPGRDHQKPHHTFRYGSISSLKKATADTEAVEYLVGHRMVGIRKHYLDLEALPLRATVALIPAAPIVGPVVGSRCSRVILGGSSRHVPRRRGGSATIRARTL
jgi:hypothetical protein